MTRAMAMVLFIVATAVVIGCDRAPGRRSIDAETVAPDKVLDFSVLYRTNCAGCHGLEGRGGAAIALSDPVYLAIADDVVVRRATADGISGTAMPAFARGSGGMLTAEQIDAIVKGIRASWAKPGVVAGIDLPPYSDGAGGQAQRGSHVFATYCASCHGNRGQGAGASSITDGSYLALVSDQGLRTTVIAGRPELGAPDWRGNVPGKTMTPQDITDVVAWLSAQRQPFPGQPYQSGNSRE
ncbi:MAG TPA: c-type cytochrome [Vicinamibacterales bacterium]|nr:c-type cytochrome [Vicinamibacterales bacterium]